MHAKGKLDPNKFILAIHSTNNYFGFALKNINENSDAKFFLKKFDRDLSNNLIFDLTEFLSGRSFNSIERISVSNGPANFNATRLIVVLARTISQQINCPLDYFSCYRLMAKRIAINNNITQHNSRFWIINNLKHRGYIAGEYMVNINQDGKFVVEIKELIKPMLYKDIDNKNINYKVDYDTKDDLTELLALSIENHNKSAFASWEKVLPIYPLSPTN